MIQFAANSFLKASPHIHTQKGGVNARRVEEGEKAEVHIFGDNNIIRVRIPQDQERVGAGQAREHFKEA